MIRTVEYILIIAASVVLLFRNPGAPRPGLAV